MKALAVMLAAAAVALTATARPPRTSGSDVDSVLEKAQEMGLDEGVLSDLWHASEDVGKVRDSLLVAEEAYRAAESNYLETCYRCGVLERPRALAAKKGKSQAEKDLEEMRRQVAKSRNRFEVLKKTINRWGPHTNLNVRAARQTMQARLDETRAERDAAKAYEKMVKEIRKARDKDAKNAQKLREDIEKYRGKAETEAFRQCCEGLLEVMGDAPAK